MGINRAVGTVFWAAVCTTFHCIQARPPRTSGLCNTPPIASITASSGQAESAADSTRRSRPDKGPYKATGYPMVVHWALSLPFDRLPGLCGQILIWSRGAGCQKLVTWVPFSIRARGPG
ncbi:hypothetical protein N656DRAFT_782812 [Canariomyces notabilis]|uniref:Secreted protein n=1 Tax=Canariomyces notabilis TaxID=2074819 RepID=A0AAN6QKD9_9PEZI|nr:hypothetical protein N656DRAFT_782812 [Canariomyces arenarius]